MSQATLQIPVDSLRSLPANAEYRAGSGRASAVVRFEHDTIFVYATCDSLQRQCEYYERTATIYKEGYDELQNIIQEANEQRSNPVKTAFISLLAGVIIGVLSTIIIKRFKK